MSRIYLLALFFLTACYHYPLGISESEWLILTPQQQLDARLKQAKIDEAERLRRDAEESVKEAAERERQRMIEYLYDQADYGDVVECVVRGTVDFRPGWKQIEDLVFLRVRGEGNPVELESGEDYDTINAWVEYSESGRNVKFCRYGPDQEYRNQCAAISGAAYEFESGKGIKLGLSEIINGSMFCAYPGTASTAPTVVISPTIIIPSITAPSITAP